MFSTGVLFSVLFCSFLCGAQAAFGFSDECVSPVNCGAGEVCRGRCYEGEEGELCTGQCLSTNLTDVACTDVYPRCYKWLDLCSNSVVTRVCQKSCGNCQLGLLSTCPDGFMCDGTCVPLTYLCDGVEDCVDKTDEMKCHYFTHLWKSAKDKRRCGIRTNEMPISTQIVYSKSKQSMSLRKRSRGRTKRLVNGGHVKAYSWPWNGLLIGENQPQSRKRVFCGVTLIHEDWAITAAHCVISGVGVRHPNLVISFGKHYTGKTPSERITNQVRNATKILLFKDYAENDLDNDIALIRLNASVILNQYVNIACLPLYFDVEQFQRTGGVATGWGNDEHGNLARKLKQTLVRPMDRVKCVNRIFDVPTGFPPGLFSLGPSVLCTEIDRENGFGVICDGDSGGPMVVRRPTGAYSVLGVASFGTHKDCNKSNEAAVYTNVYYYLPWIEHYVNVTYV